MYPNYLNPIRGCFPKELKEQIPIKNFVIPKYFKLYTISQGQVNYKENLPAHSATCNTKIQCTDNNHTKFTLIHL